MGLATLVRVTFPLALMFIGAVELAVGSFMAIPISRASFHWFFPHYLRWTIGFALSAIGFLSLFYGVVAQIRVFVQMMDELAEDGLP